MKKIRLTRDQLLAAFNILNAANYKQMDDGDKIKLWRIVRAMKPSATQFEEASKDAAEKLKPEGIEAMLEKAREYEQKMKSGKADKLPLTEEEYQTWMREVWLPYSNLVNKAVGDIAQTEVEIEFEPLTEEAFGKLMASNDWKIQQADVVGELIIE